MTSRWVKSAVSAGWLCSIAIGVALGPLRAEEAQNEVQLVYKLKSGDVLRHTTTTTGKGNTTISGIPGQQGQPLKVPIETTNEMAMRLATRAVHEDGSADVEMAFDSMSVETTAENTHTRMTWTKDGIEMVVDGKKQDPPEELKNSVAWIGKVIRLKMSNRGAMLGGDWSALKGMDQFMGGLDFEQMMKMSQPSLPDKPVKPGDKWTQKMDLKLPGAAAGKAGAMAANIDLTYVGMEQVDGTPCAKIDLSGTMSVEDMKATGPPVGAPQNSQVTIDGMHVYMDGSLYFDPAAGRPVQQTIDMDLSVVATISGKAGDAPNAQAFQITTDTEMKMTTVTKVELVEQAAETAAEAPKAPAGQ